MVFWDIDRVIRRFWGIWGGLGFTTAGILLFSSSRIRGNHRGFMSRLGWLMWFLDIDMYEASEFHRFYGYTCNMHLIL